MPKPAGSNTGQDYSRISQTLNSSALQKSDNNAYQAFAQLIEAAKTFQGFVNNQFPQLDGSLSSLFNFAQQTIAELEIRNNSRFALSITQSESVSIPPNIETILEFDTTIFDDGLIQISPTELRINDDAIWNVLGRVTFCIPTLGEMKINVGVQDGGAGLLPNVEPRIINWQSCYTGQGKFIINYSGLIDLLRNDIVTISVFHTASTNIDVLATCQLARVTYVEKTLGVRPRRYASQDDTVCSDNSTGTDDCECILTGIQFAVLPQSNKTYFLNKDAKITSQTPFGSASKPAYIQSTFCPNRKGNFYIAIDNTDTGNTTRLEEVTTQGTFVTKYDLTIKIGQGGSGGYHSLMELPCDMILSVNRSTHKLTEYDLGINQVSRVMGLTIDPFDGCVNQHGNRLLYVNGGTKLSIWDTKGDTSMGDLVNLGFAIAWPTWLTDCTVMLFKGAFLTNGDLIRINLAGAVTHTYTYNQSVFPNGLIGYAANVGADRLWIVGLDSLFRVTTTILKLSDGSLIAENVNWMFAPNIINNNAMVSAIYQAVKCDIASP